MCPSIFWFETKSPVFLFLSSSFIPHIHRAWASGLPFTYNTYLLLFLQNLLKRPHRPTCKNTQQDDITGKTGSMLTEIHFLFLCAQEDSLAISLRTRNLSSGWWNMNECPPHRGGMAVNVSAQLLCAVTLLSLFLFHSDLGNTCFR